MSSDASADLERWIPRLIAEWRRSRAAQKKSERGHRHAELPTGPLNSGELNEVAKGVKRLSLGLTRERELVGAKYMDDPQLLGAYLLFYWPVSYAQARSTLSELTHRPRSVLDLGSGPGPLAFAAHDFGATDVTAADRSEKALTLARALAVAAEESLQTREWSPERPIPDGMYDLISMGHLINELFNKDIAKRASFVEAALAKVKPQGSVVILEPALRETSRGLLAVRDVLVERGYAVRAPCLFRGACPALIKESDWCHAERQWKMPALTASIARAAGLHKEALKMSYLVLAPKSVAWAEPPEGTTFRIVSESLEGKGRQRYMGCGPTGRIGLALQERHKNEANTRFFELARGDVIRVDETEPRGDGVTLTEKSTVTVIAPAGRPVPPREN